ncbi:hypothetical protein HPY31_17680 [Brevibacillus sp. HB1.3]|nr:hypothetical protein [Brevibacillus sp. HB1.3]
MKKVFPGEFPTKIERFIDVIVGFNSSLGLKSDGTVWGWGSNYEEDTPMY